MRASYCTGAGDASIGDRKTSRMTEGRPRLPSLPRERDALARRPPVISVQHERRTLRRRRHA